MVNVRRNSRDAAKIHVVHKVRRSQEIINITQ